MAAPLAMMGASPGAPVPGPGPGPQDAWNNAPFEPALAAEVRALAARLSTPQCAWLSGYLAGLLAPSSTPLQAAVSSPRPAPVTILYGSQSGNGEALARRTAARLASSGVGTRLLDMLDCRKGDLEQTSQLLVIVSTHGDGDPPERAQPLFELLSGKRAPRLPDLRYAVLALGDRSYEQFCAAGQKIDTLLEKLGARRLCQRVDCDVEFEADATKWMDAVGALLDHPQASPAPAAPAQACGQANVLQAWTRKHPFKAPVLANHGLTAAGSSKEVRHLELSLEGSGISYEPGDALGIVPRNHEPEVDALISLLGFDAEAPVPAGDTTTSLRSALLHHFEIGTLTASFLRRHAEATGHATLRKLVEDRSALHQYLRGRDVRDAVADFPPADLDPAAFTRLLSPLAPRLYSIASSPRATPDEVHLTVGVIRHHSSGRQRQGVVSGAIPMLPEDADLPVYLHRNEGFRLPRDPSTPILMVGAGTGVAPFRGFMAEREATGARGPNWLVFGDRSFEHDFLYQAEWLAWRRSGLLHRIDVAFSRDQPEKVYVQHRLHEHGGEIWRWLQEGAHLYLCGDASRMAVDVETTLREVFARHGGLDAEAAADHLRLLQRERRYQRDVY